ncbi:GAP family protein [Actinoplanes regularis]|uniref:GAP family protein n=1 Tax=Actinoplanes regularis TaxID=52697 RepID=UPI0024A097C2|nr:GAP family protein [Actinoplanes regularis]GLW28266.1 hypothetical protein Areg01_12060 [Actinoplanes regularis]
MNLPLLGSLAVLALIDSTSFGTLLIPIWLLLDPGRVRPGRILIFLGTVGAFYFAVGVTIALVAGPFLPQISRAAHHPAATWAQLFAGIGLFLWSLHLDRRHRSGDAGGRMVRWRERALSGETSIARLALVAAAAEVTTMLPYLAAIGLLTTATLPAGRLTLAMAGYCLLMIVPALLLLAARLAAGDRVAKPLTRFNDWFVNSNSASWIVGVIGFLLAYNAVAKLGVPHLNG